MPNDEDLTQEQPGESQEVSDKPIIPGTVLPSQIHFEGRDFEDEGISKKTL